MSDGIDEILARAVGLQATVDGRGPGWHFTVSGTFKRLEGSPERPWRLSTPDSETYVSFDAAAVESCFVNEDRLSVRLKEVWRNPLVRRCAASAVRFEVEFRRLDLAAQVPDLVQFSTAFKTAAAVLGVAMPVVCRGDPDLEGAFQEAFTAPYSASAGSS